MTDRLAMADVVRRRSELARWLADHHATADGVEHSADQWEEWILQSAADQFFESKPAESGE